LRKLGALIRANFSINPNALSDEDFLNLATEAEYMEGYRALRQKVAVMEAIAELLKK
jgi:hypothetical protein